MNKKTKATITVGIPASGKTTWSKEFVKANIHCVRICRDDFRFMLKDAAFCDNNVETLISDLVIKTAIKCLVKHDIIIDATHVKLSYINEIVNALTTYCDIEFKVFDEEYNVCLNRNAERERKVPMDVMAKMQDNFEILKKNFDFKSIPQTKPYVEPHVEGLPHCVLCDIDGTIALMGDRSPFEWKKVGVDSVNEPVAHLLYNATSCENYDGELIFISGRDEICRNETEQWIKNNNIHAQYDVKLFMRPANDFRKDSIIKKEIYDNNIKGKYNVDYVIDDRMQVLEMWHKLGLFTINVNQGNREF